MNLTVTRLYPDLLKNVTDPDPIGQRSPDPEPQL